MKLTLSDGSCYEGQSFGASRDAVGELVFATGMVGYVEALTDPSFFGQILVLTYPLQGNYGVPEGPFESDRIQVRGVVLHRLAEAPSHATAVRSLADWLKAEGIPGISGVDTRALTRCLRSAGPLEGRLQHAVHERSPDELARHDARHRGDLIEPSGPLLHTSVSQVAGNSPKYTPASPQNTRDEAGASSPTILVIDTGVKRSIVRALSSRGAQVWSVPYHLDWERFLPEVDGILFGNGPGDPRELMPLVARIKPLLEGPLPIFGVCLGHQLLGLAAGAPIEKLPFGHRSLNQPVMDLDDRRCYITSQNHGYVVLTDELPDTWQPWFINLNDGSSEGIRHQNRAISSVQFHPEAAPGPVDTAYLFDRFLTQVRESKELRATSLVRLPAHAPSHSPARVPTSAASLRVVDGPPPRPSRVLILGSGALKIGQAGEFDYSGAQAIKAVKQQGVYTVLLNPNIATIQTSEGYADATYLLPLDPESVTQVLTRERIDGLMLSFGGQDALNCGLELARRGILDALGVRVLGTPIRSIEDTEDRQRFVERLREIGVCCARSRVVQSVEDAVTVAESLGFPVMLRSGFALGGMGSGVAQDAAACRTLATRALAATPQLLVEECLLGWKEIEYEVVRDHADNCITVCNMENVDPMGIHTGESIVVAPSQTLSDREYQMLREIAIRTVRHLKIVGECNIQYALHPQSGEYRVIEVNARLSRSSALASKATGYPLATVAARLALGDTLPDIPNAITRCTTSFFEPALDYVVCKLPRWDLSRFHGADLLIGTEMKSVGEVMAIGRSFGEVLQKGLRMLEIGVDGLDPDAYRQEDLEQALRCPTPFRIFSVARALAEGWTVPEIHAITHLDPYFLHEIAQVMRMRASLIEQTLVALSPESLLASKCQGFSDPMLARLLKTTSEQVRMHRHALGIRPHLVQIDTLAGEYPAETNYLYLTYAACQDDIERPVGRSLLVLGSGCYRIGSSVEFDWCCVGAAGEARALGFETLLLNCNPETVSTDYDSCDRLIFDEISLETVLELWDSQAPDAVIVAMGGQTANCLARPLARAGVRLAGTAAASIDRAEDRRQFASLLDAIGIAQPRWWEAVGLEDLESEAATRVGFPLLVRPSYVLSGAAMTVVHRRDALRRTLSRAAEVSPEHPVVLTSYLEGAREVELDAVAVGGRLLVYALSEHIEYAGVHSGDATLVCPPFSLHPETLERVVQIGEALASHLQITGPFNVQLLAKAGVVQVIECNLRASRSLPFVSKVLGVNFIRLATRAMLGDTVELETEVDPLRRSHVGVKAAQFSFQRLRGVDPRLGVEMASTGEVGCLAGSLEEALLKSLQATGVDMPGQGVLLQGDWGLPEHALEMVAERAMHLGLRLFALGGCASRLMDAGLKVVNLPGLDGTPGREKVRQLLQDREIDLVISIPEQGGDLQDAGYRLRRLAADLGVPLLTNAWLGLRMLEAMTRSPKASWEARPWQFYIGRDNRRRAVLAEGGRSGHGALAHAPGALTRLDDPSDQP